MLKQLANIWNNANRQSSNRGIEHFLADSIDLFERGHFQAASKRFSEIIEIYPDHPLAHLMLGRSYVELKQFDKAIESFKNHLKIVPNSVEAMIYLGLAFYECDELALAQEKFEDALRIRSTSLLAKENLIITKIYSNNLNEALTDLLELHASYSQDRYIIELIILTLGRLGKWEAAKQYINHSLHSSRTVALV